MTVFEMNNAIEKAMHPQIDKYAIYLRKSREDLKAEARGEGETLARHKKILADLAARRGLYVEKIYEEVTSGETIADREQIQQLITDCYAGKYRGIIVVEVSRLSRGNQGDAQKILDCLKYSNNNNGLLVITPTKTYDVAHNPDDEEYMEFELFMSRREYKMITKRLIRGREQAVIEGNYVASVRPYGYDIDENKKIGMRTLKERPSEGQIVRKIFEWRVNHGMSPGEIARKLTNQGVPTYNEAMEWHRDTIKGILKNPIYCGKVKWNSRMAVKQMVNGELVKIRRNTTDTERYLEYDGKHDGLVSEEMFRAAQGSFINGHTRDDYTLQNPLAGLLVCQNCQRTMKYYDYKVSKGTRKRYNHSPSEVCKIKSVYYDDIINALIHGLKLHLENFQMLLDNQPDIAEDEIEKQIHILEQEKKKVERKLAKAFDDYEDEVYTANEFIQRKAKHNARIEAIEKEIRELEETIPDRTAFEEKIVFLVEAVEMLKDDDISAETKNNYLKQFISKIEFSRENDEEFILDIYLY